MVMRAWTEQAVEWEGKPLVLIGIKGAKPWILAQPMGQELLIKLLRNIAEDLENGKGTIERTSTTFIE